MSGAKHTRGPWVVEQPHSTSEMRIIALHSHAIAVVCRNVYVDDAVHAANARLLAAAPLMFELLCELRQVERWPAYDPSGTTSRVAMVVPSRLLERVDAVIAELANTTATEPRDGCCVSTMSGGPCVCPTATEQEE